ncbi:hypothetical protein [Enterococcus durans]|nr:hypothetical protein [Enterococcus durans]MDB1655207.1 hypothetical protein [Enterococcus durans]
MKKKILLFASFLCGGSLLSGCVQEEAKQDTTITAAVSYTHLTLPTKFPV